MGRYISKSHNKSMLLYHLICTVKYRRDVLTETVTNTLVNVCMEIAETSMTCPINRMRIFEFVDSF